MIEQPDVPAQADGEPGVEGGIEPAGLSLPRVSRAEDGYHRHGEQDERFGDRTPGGRQQRRAHAYPFAGACPVRARELASSMREPTSPVDSPMLHATR